MHGMNIYAKVIGYITCSTLYKIHSYSYDRSLVHDGSCTKIIRHVHYVNNIKLATHNT